MDIIKTLGDALKEEDPIVKLPIKKICENSIETLPYYFDNQIQLQFTGWQIILRGDGTWSLFDTSGG